MKFELVENIEEKDIADIIFDNLRKQGILTESKVEDTGLTKKCDNIEIVYKTDKNGILILPADWRDEDDDYAPSYSSEEILDLLAEAKV